MKLKKVKVVGNETDHAFEIGQEVLVIQDYHIDGSEANTYLKVCLGKEKGADTIKQVLVEPSLELVEEVEYPDMKVVGYFDDAYEVEGVDLGDFDELGMAEEVQAQVLEQMTDFAYAHDLDVPETVHDVHLVVLKDPDGDHRYDLVMSSYIE